MDTMFIHLDEELTNARLGRIPAVYRPDDLVFWIQFYSLFYDRLYVPANFLLDSNMAYPVLQAIGALSRESALYSPQATLRFLWDTSRFPHHSFADLLNDLSLDDAYVSMRDPNIARSTAELCDSRLQHLVVHVDMSSRLDPKESVLQLRNEVFDGAANRALDPAETDRLREFLGRLEARGDLLEHGDRFGYGRNFYYTILGYGRSEKQKHLEKQFSDITADYQDLWHHFLTAVDYVSHRLKARFASRALGSEIGILLPKEYNRVVQPVGKIVTLASGEGRARAEELVVGDTVRYCVSPDAVTGLTRQQLEQLHDSDEYRDWKTALRELRAYGSLEEDSARAHRRAELERALSTYLDRVCGTLNPTRYYADRGISLIARSVPTVAGLSVRVALKFLQNVGGPNTSDEGIYAIAEGVELASKSATGWVRRSVLGGYQLQNHTLQMTEDVSVYCGDAAPFAQKIEP